MPCPIVCPSFLWRNFMTFSSAIQFVLWFGKCQRVRIIMLFMVAVWSLLSFSWPCWCIDLWSRGIIFLFPAAGHQAPSANQSLMEWIPLKIQSFVSCILHIICFYPTRLLLRLSTNKPHLFVWIINSHYLAWITPLIHELLILLNPQLILFLTSVWELQVVHLTSCHSMASSQ